ncbi:hypothetical protein [Stratiformator vulcanicus]|uniref:Uncharacterized protein n=1 Tax=Stratiformator vulcanicus TaxID=2527980 RepID=A0A517R7F8_9PLAN|nr:hypothetical protein [Stratiformator vulcanicus]QDT39818.1 hypothetical protein Pan189_42300 [Stratiformator vulcanicus]
MTDLDSPIQFEALEAIGERYEHDEKRIDERSQRSQFRRSLLIWSAVSAFLMGCFGFGLLVAIVAAPDLVNRYLRIHRYRRPRDSVFPPLFLWIVVAFAIQSSAMCGFAGLAGSMFLFEKAGIGPLDIDKAWFGFSDLTSTFIYAIVIFLEAIAVLAFVLAAIGIPTTIWSHFLLSPGCPFGLPEREAEHPS